MSASAAHGPELETLTASLRAVVIELEGKLPAVDIQNAWGLIDVGEPGVALENLCTQLYEYDVPVPPAVLLRIIAAGEAMQLAPDLWTDLNVGYDIAGPAPAAVQGTCAMMNDVFGSLSHIENGLERLRRERLLGALRPGLNKEDVCGQLRAAGLPSNAALEAVYSWRDGTRTNGVTLDDIHIFPGFYLLSFEDAIANYRAFLASPRWSPGWLPVFANGAGDFYLVDLHGELSGAVRHFRIEESEHPVEFRSLPHMLGTLAAGFDRGLFYTDADGYLEMDDHLFAALAAELNPGVPWWTE